MLEHKTSKSQSKVNENKRTKKKNLHRFREDGIWLIGRKNKKEGWRREDRMSIVRVNTIGIIVVYFFNHLI